MQTTELFEALLYVIGHSVGRLIPQQISDRAEECAAILRSYQNGEGWARVCRAYDPLETEAVLRTLGNWSNQKEGRDLAARFIAGAAAHALNARCNIL